MRRGAVRRGTPEVGDDLVPVTMPAPRRLPPHSPQWGCPQRGCPHRDPLRSLLVLLLLSHAALAANWDRGDDDQGE